MWGIQQNNEFTEEVQYLETLTQHCLLNINNRTFLEIYYRDDKRCIHFKDHYSICKGYDGAGLAIEKTDTKRFYLHGVISVAPYNYITNCSYPTSICIKTEFYYDFILGKSENCICC